MTIEMIRSNVSFGQGKMTRATVEPVSGNAGTIFICNCRNFKPHAQAAIEIKDNKGNIIQCMQFITNENGSLGGIRIQTKGLSKGDYGIFINGVNMMGLKSQAHVTFEVK